MSILVSIMDEIERDFGHMSSEGMWDILKDRLATLEHDASETRLYRHPKSVKGAEVIDIYEPTFDWKLGLPYGQFHIDALSSGDVTNALKQGLVVDAILITKEMFIERN